MNWFGILRQEEESGDIPVLVLDAVLDHVQAVDGGGAGAGNGGGVKEMGGLEEFDGARGVVNGLAAEAETGQRLAAVRKGGRMADDTAEIGGLDSGDGEEAVLDEEVDLLDDAEVAVAEEEVVVAEGGAGDCRLDGEDGDVGEGAVDGGDSGGEGGGGEGLAAGDGGHGGELAVGASGALVGYTEAGGAAGGERAIVGGGGDGFWRECRWFDWEIEGGHGDLGNLERGEIDEGG